MTRRLIVLTNTQSVDKPVDILRSESGIHRLSKLDEGTDILNLAQAYKAFLKENGIAHRATQDPNVAEANQVRIVKALYHFLLDHDHECHVFQCHSFKRALIGASDKIEKTVREYGMDKAKMNVRHLVLRVNQLVIDPCFTRLGNNFTGLDNYPYRELQSYFEGFMQVKQLASLTIPGEEGMLSLQDEMAHAAARPRCAIRLRKAAMR